MQALNLFSVIDPFGLTIATSSGHFANDLQTKKGWTAHRGKHVPVQSPAQYSSFHPVFEIKSLHGFDSSFTVFRQV